ncbi:hypothetical protein DI272_35035 [Streptomyces sp. Act143]|uniref:hypothetical protein n=1 Tax=Streptomyces sp. Act143 TaxID=2200760 RepID=UPI000D684B2E|nr:hypothetical protein [Streptomyces sp. Act143]PWI18777.1 hypothetical protein DI272_35035 [Streptomyces sp. Act143]
MTSSLTMKRIATALGAGAAVLALSLGGAGVAHAKIEPVDTSCTNNGGHEAPGQQPTCTGGGQTQNTENQNPAGHAPPGQN